jgi:hypothetical protein
MSIFRSSKNKTQAPEYRIVRLAEDQRYVVEKRVFKFFYVSVRRWYDFFDIGYRAVDPSDFIQYSYISFDYAKEHLTKYKEAKEKYKERVKNKKAKEVVYED